VAKAKELGYLDPQKGGLRLDVRGWQRAAELLSTRKLSDQAFVAMSFAPQLEAAWTDGIRPALEDTGYKAFRVDSREHNEKIDDLIVTEIKRSGLIVADFTGQRGGVYYETGLAEGLGIPVIRCCREDDVSNLHFDTRQYNHVVWRETQDLHKKLALRIAATIPGRAERLTST
jgi:nucleoside 2-deoxyribosyltransferase